MYAYHQACIMHVPDGSYHKPALPKKSPHCQAFTSLMGGECSQHWISHPTYQAPRRRQHTVVEQPCIPLGARNQPDHPRKRHGTYLPRRPRTNRKMDPVLAELLSCNTSLRIKDECLIFTTAKICSNVNKLTSQKKNKTFP